MSEPSNLHIDVPSPIDFCSPSEAKAWAGSAMTKRPWRIEFFDAFVRELQSLGRPGLSVLELGSGPGFLEQQILNALPNATYTMLDISSAMHELARQRLGSLAHRIQFVLVDFKSEGWSKELRSVDAVVTMQAVHELRHKRHAPKLHASVRKLLNHDGIYLACDHFVAPDAMSNSELYMTIEEQQIALKSGGFRHVQIVFQKGGLVLLRSRK